jgi:DNA-binding transcriptional LysR family regulator
MFALGPRSFGLPCSPAASESDAREGRDVAVRRVDLNLLHVFEVVLQCRSVVGASRQLGVTPSAVSHALSRLRHALGDELFVSGDSGMEPTPRALQLAPGVTDGLTRIADAINSTRFVPAEAIRTFRIAASDYSAVTVLPRAVARIAATAPQVDLRVFPLNRTDAVRQLDDGRVDVVMGWFADLPERMRRRTLVEEAEALVVRAGHPITSGPITKERLFAFPHIVVDLTGSEEQAVDGFLDERGVSRRVWIERLLLEMSDHDSGLIGRVAVSVPHYAAVPPLLLVTDMIATLPRSFALRAIKHTPLVLLELPYDPIRVNIEAIWHQRSERDAGTQWLIDEIAKAAVAPEGDGT